MSDQPFRISITEGHERSLSGRADIRHVVSIDYRDIFPLDMSSDGGRTDTLAFAAREVRETVADLRRIDAALVDLGAPPDGYRIAPMAIGGAEECRRYADEVCADDSNAPTWPARATAYVGTMASMIGHLADEVERMKRALLHVEHALDLDGAIATARQAMVDGGAK